VSAGDPGLFGPGTAAWRVNREGVVLAGGTCALLMQLAHPAVAAGVAQHSNFRADPFGRLGRTLRASYAIGFGATPDAQSAISRLNAVHAQVRGAIPETGVAYHALDPDLLLWVHATLVDTALRAYELLVEPLSTELAEEYHAEARSVALQLGIPERLLPERLADLRAEMRRLIDEGTVAVSPTARRLSAAVLYPISSVPRLVWDAVNLVSVALLAGEIRRGYGIRWSPARARGVERLAAAARRALPYLPDRIRHVPAARAAQRRVGAAV